MSRTTHIAIIRALIAARVSSACAAGVVFTGVNLAGAEFTPNQLPGIYNTHYTYPTTGEVDYFITRKGMNTIRLPFRWERLQRSLVRLGVAILLTIPPRAGIGRETLFEAKPIGNRSTTNGAIYHRLNRGDLGRCCRGHSAGRRFRGF
jgi:hypothetical protein